MSFNTNSFNSSLPRNPASKNLLDRVDFRPQTRPFLSEAQSKTDHLVSTFIAESCNYKTLTAMVGAGAAYRLARVGVLTSASPLITRGGTLLPALIRAGSFAPALAAESAVFTAIGHGFASTQSQGSLKSFGKDWALAALTLGSLKFFGSAGQNQNIVLQHLLASGGMVTGHQGAYLAGLTSKPEGDLFTQFVQAEATNLQMQGGMVLAHGLTGGRMFAMERGMDLSLRAMEVGSVRPSSLQTEPQLAFAAAAGRESSSRETRGEDPIGNLGILMMSNGESGGTLDIPRLRELAAQGNQPAITSLIKARKTHPEAGRAADEVIHFLRMKKQSERAAAESLPAPHPKAEAPSPLTFPELFSLLLQQRVASRYDLIDLQVSRKGLEIRDRARQIVAAFGESETQLILFMLHNAPSFQERLLLSNSHLTARELEILSHEYTSILTADQLASRGNRFSKEALRTYDVRDLAQVAETDPHAVGLLKVLVGNQNEAAEGILRNLDPTQLVEMALNGNRMAVSAVAHLARAKNRRAQEVIKSPPMVNRLQNLE